MNEFKHYSVMTKEATDALNCQNGKIYVDATLGGGGYSELILRQIQPNGRLVAFDVDEDAIKVATKKLKHYKNLTIVKDSYTNIKNVLQILNIEKITGGIVFDLGASLHQLTCAERGFSFAKDAPLDMRFDQDADFSAYDVVNKYRENDLVYIFSNYGEERFSKRIAKRIVETRKKSPIRTTTELANLIISATPRTNSKLHPATRVFQAIRIEVNQELQNIKNTLEKVVPLLDVGAIITVVSFHSLEDRIAKQFFREHSNEGGLLVTFTKKPLTASEEEIKENPPSRSAKLRIAKRI